MVMLSRLHRRGAATAAGALLLGAGCAVTHRPDPGTACQVALGESEVFDDDVPWDDQRALLDELGSAVPDRLLVDIERLLGNDRSPADLTVSRTRVETYLRATCGVRHARLNPPTATHG